MRRWISAEGTMPAMKVQQDGDWVFHTDAEAVEESNATLLNIIAQAKLSLQKNDSTRALIWLEQANKGA